MLKIGIIKERKSPPDERVPLSPTQVAQLNTENLDVKFVIESSNIRRFKDTEYTNLGIEVVTDVTDCDILMGVKEVPKEALIEGKKYFFFYVPVISKCHEATKIDPILQLNLTQRMQ